VERIYHPADRPAGIRPTIPAYALLPDSANGTFQQISFSFVRMLLEIPPAR
jgi:hypothetical protein